MASLPRRSLKAVAKKKVIKKKSKEAKPKKRITNTRTFNCMFSVTAAVTEGVDPESLFKDSTEWMGDPLNADGCVVNMKYKSYEYTNPKRALKIKKEL